MRIIKKPFVFCLLLICHSFSFALDIEIKHNHLKTLPQDYMYEINFNICSVSSVLQTESLKLIDPNDLDRNYTIEKEQLTNARLNVYLHAAHLNDCEKDYLVYNCDFSFASCDYDVTKLIINLSNKNCYITSK